jgi:cell division protein FtsN
MRRQRAGSSGQVGNFVVGLIVGLLVGLVLALAVALYVTKVPVPFVNKVPQRTAEQDAAEAERNRNWDPNSGLAGKTVPRPVTGASAPAPTASAPAAGPVAAVPAKSTRDPAAILGDKPAPAPTVSAAPPADPFLYYVQAGAYSRAEDAEQQRARIGLLGIEAKLSERDQAGRTMYRVRIGPFERREDADAAKDKLHGSGVDAALVRVQR